METLASSDELAHSFNVEYKKLHGVIFNLDLMLWSHLQLLLRRYPKKTALRFGLTQEAAHHLSSHSANLKRLASGVLISFKLDHNKSVLNKITGIDENKLLIGSRFSYLDINYWESLKSLAEIDIKMAMLGFSVSRRLAEWVVSATKENLYSMAMGTIGSIGLRCPSEIVLKMITEEHKEEDLPFFKKTIFALQENKLGAY